jgi:hypothetical protein
VALVEEKDTVLRDTVQVVGVVVLVLVLVATVALI